MDKFPYIETGAHLFRFMDHRTPHFWPAIAGMLSDHTLFLNTRRNFNDPFDSQPVIENDLSNRAIRDYYTEALSDPFNPRRSLQTAARIFELRANGSASLTKKRLEHIKESLRKSAQEILDLLAFFPFHRPLKIRFCGATTQLHSLASVLFSEGEPL
jgi:hypothetical protein